MATHTGERHRLLLDFPTKNDLLDFVADMYAHGALPLTANVWHADALDTIKESFKYVVSNDRRILRATRDPDQD
jgi:hypothetical protein